MSLVMTINTQFCVMIADNMIVAQLLKKSHIQKPNLLLMFAARHCNYSEICIVA